MTDSSLGRSSEAGSAQSLHLIVVSQSATGVNFSCKIQIGFSIEP
jgi:hypothetical protein